MQYMMLIYSDENAGPAPGTPEFGALMEGYGAFTQEVKENGVMNASDPLQPVTTATTVRVRRSATETTDGPFAETKEQLGGYYILDRANFDEAIEYAARIPSAAYGSIGIRPVMVFE